MIDVHLTDDRRSGSNLDALHATGARPTDVAGEVEIENCPNNTPKITAEQVQEVIWRSADLLKSAP